MQLEGQGIVTSQEACGTSIQDRITYQCGCPEDKDLTCTDYTNEQLNCLNSIRTNLEAGNTKEDIKSTGELVVGGQIGDYPATAIVSLNLVIEAVKFYFENGRINKELSWTEE